jgi:hypothetical protein
MSFQVVFNNSTIILQYIHMLLRDFFFKWNWFSWISKKIFIWMLQHIVYPVQLKLKLGSIVVVIIWCLDLQLAVQSLSITTKVVSLNTSHGEVYSIQRYVIKIVSDFLWLLRFTPPIKQTAMNRYSWNIVESGVKLNLIEI